MDDKIKERLQQEVIALAGKVTELTAQLKRVAPAPAQAAELQWAVSRWHAEVANRPLVNIHRRALDDTWRQVIRHFGGDPDSLIGPSHDSLRATTTQMVPSLTRGPKAEPAGRADRTEPWTDEQREQFRRDRKDGPRCDVCSVILGGQHFPSCSKEGT